MSFNVPVPRISQRRPGLVSLTMPVNSNYSKYKVSGHKTLDGAFAAPVLMFEIESGAHFVSGEPQKRRVGAYSRKENHLTTMDFNPSDFKDPVKTPGSVNLPLDSQFLFITVQPFSISANAYLTGVPIVLIPSPEISTIPDAMITLSGTAPGISATAGEAPPAGSMGLFIPRRSRSLTISNYDAQSLLFSFGAGMPMAEIPASQGPLYLSGSATRIFLASPSGSASSFSIIASLAET